ncbi:hypothetical protein B0E53_06615 [Micromonospora sp. MH33]|nr:hypothetical protein B0E53_06615 [Micromonospora sp. MH33]
MFQIRTVPSRLAAAIIRPVPACHDVTAVTALSWPVNLCRFTPLAASQISTSPSLPPEATSRSDPACHDVTAVTPSVWSSNVTSR